MLRSIRLALLFCLLSILSGCAGGGGGGSDSYLLGGGNEGTGVEVKELIQVDGMVIDENERPVDGTATINDSFGTNISSGRFSVAVPISVGPQPLKISVERAGSTSGSVTIDQIDSAATQGVTAYIELTPKGATLADVTLTKRGASSRLSDSARRDLNAVDKAVNDQPNAQRDNQGDGAEGDAGEPAAGSEFDPELVGAL